MIPSYKIFICIPVYNRIWSREQVLLMNTELKLAYPVSLSRDMRPIWSLISHIEIILESLCSRKRGSRGFRNKLRRNNSSNIAFKMYMVHWALNIGTGLDQNTIVKLNSFLIFPMPIRIPTLRTLRPFLALHRAFLIALYIVF